MKLEWLGHACFLLETEDGVKIVTDPYQPGSFSGAVGYADVNVKADIVTVSHAHADHNYTQAVPGARVIESPEKVRIGKIDIEGVRSFHDYTEGSLRGNNIIFIFTIEGLKIVHLGDLGHIPSDTEKIANADVVCVPVGGTFTLSAKEATQLVELMQPTIIIPMHFKTEKLGFSIDGVDKFIKGKSNVQALRSSSLEIRSSMLPEQPTIIVLKPSR